MNIEPEVQPMSADFEHVEQLVYERMGPVPSNIPVRIYTQPNSVSEGPKCTI